MPNYCTNNIIIKGNKTNMDRFYQVITEKYKGKKYKWLTFTKTVPPVDSFSFSWGTKTELNEPKIKIKKIHQNYMNDENKYEIIEESDCRYHIICNTAWGPPTKWALQCAIKFELSIKIIYIEFGFGFYGKYKVSYLENDNLKNKDNVNNVHNFDNCNLKIKDNLYKFDNDFDHENDDGDKTMLELSKGKLKKFVIKNNLTSMKGEYH